MIPYHLDIALNRMGTAEVPGPGNNPDIVEWLKSVNLPGEDKIPHCSAFVNWCIEQSGLPGTKNGMARSWLNWGFPLVKPVLGCVVVLRRGVDPRLGHVGFFLDEFGGFIRIIGANQKDRVGVNAYAKLRLLSYRWHEMLIDGDADG